MKITVIEDSIKEAENFERVCLSKLTHLLEKARTENTRIEKLDDVLVQINFDSENEKFLIYELFCPVCGSDLKERWFETLQDAINHVDKNRQTKVYYCTECLNDLL